MYDSQCENCRLACPGLYTSKKRPNSNLINTFNFLHFDFEKDSIEDWHCIYSMLRVGNTVKTMTLLLASSQSENVTPSTTNDVHVPTPEPAVSFNDILPGTSLLKKNHQPNTSMTFLKLQITVFQI